MSTYSEVTSMVLDELKVNSDDSYFNEDHVMFLIDKYRSFLIQQKYKNEPVIPSVVYQTICIPLIELPGTECDGVHYLRSRKPLPMMYGFGTIQVTPYDYFQSAHIVIISNERMRFVGENRYSKNIIYCTLDAQNYLVFKSMNPQAYYLDFVRLTAIFDNPRIASEFKCDEICDSDNMQIPIEDAMIPQLIEFIVKELSGVVYKKEDVNNNAQDDLKTEAQ